MHFFGLSVVVVVALLLSGHVNGHGYMIDPPSRSSVWRLFGTAVAPANYDDNALFCGGFGVQ